MSEIKRIIVHWSVSPWSWGIEDIRRIHVEQHGWPRIAYHRVILHECSSEIKVPDHSVLVWSDLVKATIHIDDDKFLESNEIGYHAAEMNSSSIGVCVISSPNHCMSKLQQEALTNTLNILIKRFNLDIKDIFGHRDFGMNKNKGLALGNDFKLTNKAKGLNTTQCPGDEIYAFIQEFKKLKKVLA